MKIVITMPEAFKFYNDYSTDTINALEMSKAVQDKQNLIISVKDQLAAKLIIRRTFLAEEFDNKMICYFMNRDGTKSTIFEVHTDHKMNLTVQALIHRINEWNRYKSPLAYEVSIKVRDSVYSDPLKPADFRGFINLFILFSLLNYSSHIAEHFIKYKLAFATNVI